jgi:hypothetical protein
MKGLKHLKNTKGGILIQRMENLPVLDGLDGLEHIGKNPLIPDDVAARFYTGSGTYANNSIMLNNNDILNNTIALTDAQYDGTFSIYNNPKLVCVPPCWPVKDDYDRAIRNPNRSCPIPLSPCLPPADRSSISHISSHTANSSASIIAGSVVGVVFVVGVLLVLWFLRHRQRKRNESEKPSQHGEGGPSLQDNPAYSTKTALAPHGSTNPMHELPANNSAEPAESKWEELRELNYADIMKATKGFDPTMSIGNGASCGVYKGNISGVDCAIKVLIERADALDQKQFLSEMMLLASVKHENICCMIGCSFDGPQQCLALELMETDLAGRLDSVQTVQLGWEQKVFIAVCICRALVHLHSQSPPMIHR